MFKSGLQGLLVVTLLLDMDLIWIRILDVCLKSIKKYDLLCLLTNLIDKIIDYMNKWNSNYKNNLNIKNLPFDE